MMVGRKAIALGGAFLVGAFAGWLFEHDRFVAYQAKVEQLGKVAEQQARQAEAEHVTRTREIEDDYTERLADLHRRYSSRVRYPGSCDVPRTTKTPKTVDEAAANSDPDFVEMCAETTLQLDQLQKWIRQMGK